MNNTNKILWIISILAIVTAVLFTVYINKSSIFKKSTTPTTSKTQYVPTVKGSKWILESQVNFPMPSSNSSTNITSKNLDKDISMFIIYGITPEKINKESYSDGTKGFSIVYLINKNVFDTYFELLKLARSSPFKIVSASRANLASIIATESPKYKVKITGEFVSSNQTKVIVEVQNK